MSLLRLTVKGFPGGYEFHFEGKGRSLQESVPVASEQLQTLEQDWLALQGQFSFHLWDAPPKEAESLWRRLCTGLGELFPEELVGILNQKRYASVDLMVDDSLALPWGRAFIANNHLCDAWDLGRESESLSESQAQARPRGVIVTNPDGTLLQNESLKSDFVSLLESRIETVVLSGKDASVERVKKELSYPNSLVLLSGHFRSSSLSGSILLSDGELSLAELREPLKAPDFLILNVICDKAFEMPHLAPSLLEFGCRGVLAPLWAVPDQEKLLVSALRSMAEGCPLGKALRLARADYHKELGKTAYKGDHSFELWGDTSYRLPLARERSSTLRTNLSTLYNLLAEGPGFEQEFPIFEQAIKGGKRIYLGKPGPQINQIEVDDSSLPNRVGFFEYSEVGMKFTALADEVRLNGLLVGETVEFKLGDLLEFGRTQLRYKGHNEAGDSEQDSSLRAKLKLLQGYPRDDGKSAEMTDNLMLIGRGDICHFQLSDPAVSRVHFALIARENSFFLAPVSKTIVNDVMIARETELTATSEIRLTGETLLKFELEAIS